MKAIIFIETNKAGTSMEAIKAASDMNYFTILITNNKDLLKERDSYKDIHEIVYVNDITYKNVTYYIDNDMDKFYKLETILSFIEQYILLASKLRERYITFENYTCIETLNNKLNELDLTPNLAKLNSHNLIYDIIVQDHKVLSIIKIKKEFFKENDITIPIGYSLSNKISYEENKYINDIIKDLHLDFGIFSIELKDKYITIKPTISGEYTNSLISFSNNINYIKQIINLYLGKEISINKKKNNIFISCIRMTDCGYITKVTGKNTSLKDKSIKQIIMTYKKNLKYDKNDVIGYIVAMGVDYSKAKTNANYASKKLNIHVKEEI